MNELAQYLRENLILDFEGEVTTDAVRAFLREDNAPEARALLQKIIEDKGIDDLLIALADCLTQEVLKKMEPAVIQKHLVSYSEA